MGKSAKDDPVHPALEIVGDVTELFPPVEAPVSLIDKRSPAAHAGHPCFERQARAQRWLLKEHHDLLACEGCAETGWTGFHQPGKMKNIFYVLRAQIANRNQIAARQPCRRLRMRCLGRADWLAAQCIRLLFGNRTTADLRCGVLAKAMSSAQIS